MSSEHITATIPKGWSFASLAMPRPFDADINVYYDHEKGSVSLHLGWLYLTLAVDQWEKISDTVNTLLARSPFAPEPVNA